MEREQQRGFRLVFDTEAVQHLSTIERKYHSLIRRTEVHILAIGVKEGNRLYVGGEEFVL